MPRTKAQTSTPDPTSAHHAQLDELRTRADAFSKDFADAGYEMGEAQEACLNQPATSIPGGGSGQGL